MSEAAGISLDRLVLGDDFLAATLESDRDIRHDIMELNGFIDGYDMFATGHRSCDPSTVTHLDET